MEKAWEKAVEAAKGGQNPSEILSLTLDGALKSAPCKLPPAALFEQFSRLQHLSIANAGLISLEGFPSLPHLKRLVLSDNRISGGLEHLVQAGLKSLQDLDLSNNRIQAFEDLVPLSQFNLVSIDLYECPVTRLLDYRARVFDIIKSLQFLDKTDRDGKERFDSDEEGEEVDSEDEDEEDVDNFNSEDRSNGTRLVNQDEDFEEDDEEDDELDVEEEEEYQDGVTINGHGAAPPGHVAANATTGNISEDDDVEDEEDYQNAEVQDLDEEDEDDSDEVAEADDDDGVAEDDEDEEGTEQARGAPGELDVQDDEDNGEDEDGELGDEEEDDEGVDNDGEDDGEEEEEDYGTEYLVQPIGKPEDEDGGSDFEPVEDEPEDEDIDEDEDEGVAGGHKRSRDEVDDDDSEDEERNHKRR
uniref:U2A'/phosphoprotein 32 family A C-terminal domain-containing protein n=1 Tax=Araucaria cunninghamii TaxID=56994 RepID=A0A0D6R1X3_ARACU